MIGFDQTATLYTADPTTRKRTVAGARFACRLVRPSYESEALRADQEGVRRLLYDAASDLANSDQVEVDGHRYNVVANTQETVRGPSGLALFRRCQVVRT